MWRFPDVDFAKVAESFGCAGICVVQSDALNDALERAIEMDAPVGLDVVSDTYAIADNPRTPIGREFHAFQKAG